MYELTPAFWYKGIFFAELVLAESVIVYRLKRRPMFWLRLPLSAIGSVGLCCAVPVFSGIWSAFVYFAIFGITLGALCVCFDERIIKIVFCGVAAYTLQHIAYELFDLSVTAMGVVDKHNISGSGTYDSVLIYASGGITFVSGNPFTIMLYLFEYGVTYFFGYLFVEKRLRARVDFGVDNKKMFVLAVVVLFFDIVVSSVIGFYSRKDYNRVYLVFLDLFNVFCCIFAMYLQFDVDDRGRLRNDLDVIKRLWKEKEEQYAESKANIELINQKCHDLKHQIRTIGTGHALDASVVKEIESVISIYDSSVKTGNEALDVIITEKSLYCSKRDVKLCCIIDGCKLSFMTSADLYALFGNIIDNAIEAVEYLDAGKRVISLSVKETSGFLIINIYNYYDKQIVFKDKLPLTTKGDDAYHGYGMKSVQMLCNKYGGEMSVTAQNNVFTLNILFPMKREA